MERIPVRHIAAARKEPDFSGSFSIRDIHSLLAGKDMVQELHRHDFYYILVLKKGTGNHEIDFAPYTICDNSIFFMRPGQVHQLVLKDGSDGYLIQFSTEFYFSQDRVSNGLLRKASHTNYYQFNAEVFRKLYVALTDIFREYAEQKVNYQEAIKACMDIFLIGLARQQESNESNKIDLYALQRLDDLWALLETHILSHKQVAQYAAMLNLSAYQLNAITKTTLNKTCSQLINEYIILDAKRQLLATADQVNQVADHLGYEDVSYFIRFFKKHTGYSPEAFRYNFR